MSHDGQFSLTKICRGKLVTDLACGLSFSKQNKINRRWAEVMFADFLL